MQILYVTDFSIEPSPGVDHDTAIDATLGTLSTWVGDDTDPIHAADLLGERSPRTPADTRRTA